MKRTKSIDLSKMRKGWAIRPLALAVAGAALTACGGSEKATVYTNAKQCAASNPGLEEQCRASFEKAIVEAEETSPKYANEAACVAEFGLDRCAPVRGTNGQSWFMPMMAGYMFASATGRDNYYYHTPVITSYQRGSPMYGKWTTMDGRTYGSTRSRNVLASKSTFKPKPAVTKTMSRGGFGSTVTAKARMGGSRSGGSFGG